jgi:hypothetical protein
MPAALTSFAFTPLAFTPLAFTPLAFTPFAFTMRFAISHWSRGQTNRVSREIGRTVNLRQSAAKLDVLSRSSPLAGQIWRSPPLVMRGHIDYQSRTAPNR